MYTVWLLLTGQRGWKSLAIISTVQKHGLWYTPSVQQQERQLRLDAAFGPTSDVGNHSINDGFAMEDERSRAVFCYKEEATINSILIPSFLHMCYSKPLCYYARRLPYVGCWALTMESIYETVEEEERKFRRKVFWLLFITERGHAMQYDAGVVLRNKIALSAPVDDRDPGWLLRIPTPGTSFRCCRRHLVGTN